MHLLLNLIVDILMDTDYMPVLETLEYFKLFEKLALKALNFLLLDGLKSISSF